MHSGGASSGVAIVALWRYSTFVFIGGTGHLGARAGLIGTFEYLNGKVTTRKEVVTVRTPFFAASSPTGTFILLCVVFWCYIVLIQVLQVFSSVADTKQALLTLSSICSLIVPHHWRHSRPTSLITLATIPALHTILVLPI